MPPASKERWLEGVGDWRGIDSTLEGEGRKGREREREQALRRTWLAFMCGCVGSPTYFFGLSLFHKMVSTFS